MHILSRLATLVEATLPIPTADQLPLVIKMATYYARAIIILCGQ